MSNAFLKIAVLRVAVGNRFQVVRIEKSLLLQFVPLGLEHVESLHHLRPDQKIAHEIVDDFRSLSHAAGFVKWLRRRRRVGW